MGTFLVGSFLVPIFLWDNPKVENLDNHTRSPNTQDPGMCWWPWCDQPAAGRGRQSQRWCLWQMPRASIASWGFGSRSSWNFLHVAQEVLDRWAVNISATSIPYGSKAQEDIRYGRTSHAFLSQKWKTPY